MADSPYLAKITGAHTHVIRFGTGQFPAWEMPDGTFAVDLRFLGPDGQTPVFSIEELRKVGVADDMIEAARTSAPTAGFVLVRGRS